jgi:hypothetical protein
VLLCTDRATRRQVAIKYYLGADGMVDPGVFEALDGGDRRFVVPSRLESGDGEQWEVMEYFPLGSLHDVIKDNNGTPLGPDFAREFVSQMTEALDYLHGRDIVHRDIKPGNILVRSRNTLDVVIGDFGVSIRTRGTAAASVRGTWAYSPPEASFGDVSGRGDWWSLGMMTFELLTGHHVLADPASGLIPNDQQTRLLIGRGEFELSAVPDARWQLLLSGLLTRTQTDRWTGTQVREWLADRSPAVKRSAPDDDAGWIPGYAAAIARVKPVVVGEQTYTDPIELTRALTRHWSEAVRKLAGRELEDVRQLLLTAGVDPNTVNDCLSRPSPSFVLLALQGAFLPNEPPAFQGRAISGQGLTQAASQAQSGDSAAAGWIRELRCVRVLGELSRYAGNGTELALADERLSTWWQDVERWVPALKSNADMSAQLAGILARWEGELLLSALNNSAATELRRRGIREASAPGPVAAWAESLATAAAGLDETSATGTGTAAVATAVLGPARDLERSRRDAEEQTERERVLAQEREQQEQLRTTQRQLVRARRSAAGRQFRRRLMVVPLYAAAAAVLSTTPASSLERIVSREQFWQAAAVAGASVLALSIGVGAWEAFLRPVRLAARRHLLAAGIIISITLWCAHGIPRWGITTSFPATEISWWIRPPLVCGGIFLAAAGLSAVIGPKVPAADEARNVESCWQPVVAPRAIRRFVAILVVVVGLAGAAVAAQLLQVLAFASGSAASPLAGVDVPAWALTAADRIDQYLPNLPLPADPSGRLLASAAIFAFGVVMTRLYNDISRAGTTWAWVGVSIALVLNLLLVGNPGDLIQGATVIVFITMGIAIVGVVLWIIVSALAG